MSRGSLVCACTLLALLSACGDDSPAAAPDAGAPDAGELVAPPAPPNFGVCGEGWRDVTDDVAHCEPWPESGAARCGAGEMHLPGRPGCAAVGASCPAVGAWPESLPTDVRLIFVRAGAAAGDGSADAPLADIGAALALAVDGNVIVIDGTFDEAPIVDRRIELRGVCASRARIVPSTGSAFPSAGALTIRAAGVSVRDVGLGGARGGVRAEAGGDVMLLGVAIESATGIGLSIARDSALHADGVLVRGTRTSAAGRYGIGVVVEDGGATTLTRTAIESNVSAGVLTFGGSLGLRSVVIRDTEAEPTLGDVGNGLEILGGALVDAELVVLEGNRDASVMVIEASRLTMRDSVIRDTRALLADDSGGDGLVVLDGASAGLDRVVLSGNRESGVLASGVGSRVTLRDVLIRDTDARVSDGYGGSGIAAQQDAIVSAERSIFVRNRGTGVIVSSAASLTLDDVLVQDTRGFAGDGFKGTGLHAQRGGTIRGARIAVLDNREVGILAIEGDSRITLSDVRVEGTQQRACAMTTCPDVTFGDGLVAAVNAQITLERFVVADNARVGVLVGGGTIDLHVGRVSGNPIGANLQTPGFDALRISDGITFVDNGRNLDTMALPVPSSEL